MTQTDLSGYRVLVLDVAFQTIDVISWQRAICLAMFEKVECLEYYDGAFACSAYAAYCIPAVGCQFTRLSGDTNSFREQSWFRSFAFHNSPLFRLPPNASGARRSRCIQGGEW